MNGFSKEPRRDALEFEGDVHEPLADDGINRQDSLRAIVAALTSADPTVDKLLGRLHLGLREEMMGLTKWHQRVSERLDGVFGIPAEATDAVPKNACDCVEIIDTARNKRVSIQMIGRSTYRSESGELTEKSRPSETVNMHVMRTAVRTEASPFDFLCSRLEHNAEAVFSVMDMSERSESRVRFRYRVRELVRHPGFQVATSFLIVLNSIWIGYDTAATLDASIKYYRLASAQVNSTSSLAAGARETGFLLVDIIFCILFAIEMSLRIVSERRQFCTGSEKRWNIFDLTLVITAFVDLLPDVDVAMTFARIIRLLRIVRVLRVVRLVRFLHELRVMLSAVLNSITHVFHALMLVFMLSYISGIFLCHGVSEYVVDHHNYAAPSTEQASIISMILKYFYSVPMALTTMFMVVTDGVSWWEIGEPLFYISDFHGVVFVGYIALMGLGALNIITGLFVSAGCDLSQMDRDIISRTEMVNRAQAIKNLKALFAEMDTEQHGMIDKEHFKACLKNNDVNAYLEALEISFTRADTLFKLLDTDGDGAIEIDEFVMGCLKLRGVAQSADVANLMVETDHLMHVVKQEGKKTRRALDDITGFVHQHASLASNTPAW